MDKISFFPENLNVRNQSIILRLDLNVPIKNKIIIDDTRIILCLPFIKKLIEKKAKVIIISHLGRPGGFRDPALSLIPIYKYLKKTLPTNVFFFMGNFDEQAKDKFSHLKEGEIIYIPAYWWDSIHFKKMSTVCLFKYRTFMNTMAISPELIVAMLQGQNIKREVVTKMARSEPKKLEKKGENKSVEKAN